MENNGIFCPRGKVWKTSDECVWDAPDFITSKEPLKAYYGDQPLIKKLFYDYFSIKDVTVDDILAQLKQLSDIRLDLPEGKTLHETVKQIYEYLRERSNSDQEWDLIRYVIVCFDESVSAEGN